MRNRVYDAVKSEVGRINFREFLKAAEAAAAAAAAAAATAATAAQSFRPKATDAKSPVLSYYEFDFRNFVHVD